MVNEKPEDRLNLLELERDGLGFDPYHVIESSLNAGSDTIYFLNVLKNRLDTGVKRGAIVKALAVGSREKSILEPLTKLMESTLDLIYESQNLDDPVEKNVERYTAIISEMYKSVNAHSQHLL